jgi:tetratricopeptide (TPR) repeat protein
LALEEYLLAVQLEPEQDWMHFRLAQFYEAQGEIDLAWEQYEKLVGVSDNQVWAHSVLGDFLRAQELYDLAIESYKRAKMFNPEDATVYVRLGETYLDKYLLPNGQEQDAQEAEQAFDEALTRLPDYFPARFYIFAPRGRLYFHQKRYDLAIDDFERALEINPLSPEIQFSLARAYDAAEEVQEACAAYEKVLEPEMNAMEEWMDYARRRMQVLCDG